MSMGVDLSVQTLYDQIWAYARFINEAPDLKEYVRLNPRGGAYFRASAAVQRSWTHISV